MSSREESHLSILSLVYYKYIGLVSGLVSGLGHLHEFARGKPLIHLVSVVRDKQHLRVLL